jgi:uncharacterized membrane protein YfcA
MTLLDAAVGVAIGLIAGVLSGLFGVGGGILMTPGIQVLLAAEPIVALATPLPAILPTAVTGALTYRRAGEVDVRAATWMVVAGLPASAIGAQVAEVLDAHGLLLATALLLAWQAVGILRVRRGAAPVERSLIRPVDLAAIGLVAGFVSGLLGIGGGIIMVPLMVGWLGMPLKRALGTSLAAIVALVVPGTAVHAVNGNVDWAVFAAVAVGAVPGARIGARLALGTRERTLRLLVGSFLLLVAVVYGAGQAASLFGN